MKKYLFLKNNLIFLYINNNNNKKQYFQVKTSKNYFCPNNPRASFILEVSNFLF